MLAAVAVLSTLAFIGWVIYRALKGRLLRAHHVTYGLAIISGIYTVAFFLSMDIAQLIKIVISIVLGIALIFMAAHIQRRRQKGSS